MHNRLASLLLLVGALLLPRATTGQTTPSATRGHRPANNTSTFNVKVPVHAYDLILSRPEDKSITWSVLAYQDLEGYVAFGTAPGVYTGKTPIQQFKKDAPAEVVLGSLLPNTRYYFQFRSRTPGTEIYANAGEGTFHTARAKSSTFVFTMTADVHLDEHTTPDIYLRTLGNIRADKADFHIDLGNLFMTDKHATRDEAGAQYLAQRYYLGQIGGATPILLALGTHDGEAARYDDGSPDALAPWSNQIRTRYFPNPIPDDFYSGNKPAKATEAPLQNYYAWEWGDALFVVLDPFRYSLRQRGGGDGWAWSLGQMQYQWLDKTLAASHAKFKFVFIHNLLSGDQASRGGVEIAGFNEWGGKNPDGTEGFKEHRPGWDLPVHQLLVRNHVAAVFKAHDNFYARQELDGIVYLMVPQPSFAGNDRIRDLETYGYKKGTFLGNSGHVRVTIAPDQVKTEYVRSCLPQDEGANRKNGVVADSCTIVVKGKDGK